MEIISESPMKNIMDLSDDCLTKVIEFLTGAEVMSSIRAVNQRFGRLIRNENLWFTLCIREKGIYFKDPDSTWYALYHSDTTGICTHLNAFSDHYYNLKYYPTEKNTNNNNNNFIPILKILESANLVNKSMICCSQKNCNSKYENLWICIEEGCFHVGCGRRDNKHALLHHKSTKHPITLKLNSIELWCYVCERWCGSHNNTAEMKFVSHIKHLFETALGTPLVPQEIHNRRLIERNLANPSSFDTKTLIVPMQWEIQWERFIIGDLPFFNTPINNTVLLDDHGKVRVDIVENRDYVDKSLEAWEYFMKVYGGGPVVAYDWINRKWVVESDTPKM